MNGDSLGHTSEARMLLFHCWLHGTETYEYGMTSNDIKVYKKQ
jgi:hypothetical protein